MVLVVVVVDVILAQPFSMIQTPEQGESLQAGDKVLVITKNGIQSHPVISFIHGQPEVGEGFLKIVSKVEKTLLITADHLMFVELMSQATTIPARDVKR